MRLRLYGFDAIRHRARWDWGLEGIWIAIAGLYVRSQSPWDEGFYECDGAKCDAIGFVSDADPSVLEDDFGWKVTDMGEEVGTIVECPACWAKSFEAEMAARAEYGY